MGAVYDVLLLLGFPTLRQLSLLAGSIITCTFRVIVTLHEGYPRRLAQVRFRYAPVWA